MPGGWGDSAPPSRHDPPVGIMEPEQKLDPREKRKKEREEKQRKAREEKESKKKSESKVCLQ